MLNLNYYFVDVGENYCTIAEYNCMLSLRDAILNKDSEQLKVIREFIKNTFKKKSRFSSVEEFKIVFVNKVDKLFLESEVEDISTHTFIDPVLETDAYNVYLMEPSHALSIKCQVLPNEVENRYIQYQYIKSPVKQKRRRK